MGQEIIKIEDIVGGGSLIERTELDSFVKKNEVGTAASRDEDYFAKSDEVPPLPQYTIEIKREDIVWTDDYITIPHSTHLRDKKIEIYKAILRKGSGDIILNPRVSYPRSETYNSTPPNEFYLKDGDGYITKGNDFEYLYIEYSIFTSTELYNYDVRNLIGENVIQDEMPGETYHSDMMRRTFLACYPELWFEYNIESIETIKDTLTGNNALSAAYEPKYMELKKANMLFKPYSNGASNEQIGSNPNILKVGAHYGNYSQLDGQQRRDITSAPEVFLTNVVAVAARVDDTTTLVDQTSYGYGVEFFEDIPNLNIEFPDKTFLRDTSTGTIDATGLIYTANQLNHPDWVSKVGLQVGEKIYINVSDKDNPDESENSVVAEIINDYTVRVETPLTSGTGKIVYVYGDLSILGGQQQSPTCSIVGAKLKKIKLLSGVNWQIVREAARATAKKTIGGVFDNYHGDWDMYRGYGKIQPDDAIDWIDSNYKSASHREELAFRHDQAYGINPAITYDDLLPNSPVAKRHIEDAIPLKEDKSNKKSIINPLSTDEYPNSKAVADEFRRVDEDVLVNKVGIATLENTLNSANINQEPTATVTGVDTVSLPKTAANTGMQVQLFGQSAENLVTGGKLIIANTFAYGSGIKIDVINGNKYYAKRLYQTISGTNGTATGRITTLNPTHEFIKAPDSSRVTTYSEATEIQKDLYMYGPQTGTVRNGEFSDVMIINLTATFGAGNEPTKEQCDLLFANYFEGTDNVLGTGRVRSVDADGENASILQLTTPPLRSNGLIKDEIRKGANGYELVKRVGVGTLGGELITNGNFNTDTTGWTAVNSVLSVDTGMLKVENITETFHGYAYQAFTTIIGRKYILKLSHKNGTREGLIRVSTTSDSNNLHNSSNYNDINTTDRYVLFTATTTTAYIRLLSSPGTIGSYTLYDNIFIKEFTETNGLSTGSIFTEFGTNVHYTLATPVITPIPHAGLLNSNSNGTAYFEPIIADAGVYSSNIAIQLSDYPISSFEQIRKYANGAYTELNIATAVIASGGLSFTHPDLASGDLVMFTYTYNKESIGRGMTLTHYDSRHVKLDTANGKTYRIVPVVTNGVVTWSAVEV